MRPDVPGTQSLQEKRECLISLLPLLISHLEYQRLTARPAPDPSRLRPAGPPRPPGDPQADYISIGERTYRRWGLQKVLASYRRLEKAHPTWAACVWWGYVQPWDRYRPEAFEMNRFHGVNWMCQDIPGVLYRADLSKSDYKRLRIKEMLQQGLTRRQICQRLHVRPGTVTMVKQQLEMRP